MEHFEGAAKPKRNIKYTQNIAENEENLGSFHALHSTVQLQTIAYL